MIATLALILLLQAQPERLPQPFQVRHQHTVGSCTGTLAFSATEIRFETKEKTHQRVWTYPDVKFFEIVSTGELIIHSYEDESPLKLGNDRDYAFKLTQGEITSALYEFLVARSPRAVVTKVIFASTVVIQEIPVRHRHTFGGCQGILTIAEGKIIFRTQQEGDSRLWRLKDVESFASNDPFQLRVSTAFETFNFDLKLPLQEAAYEYIWKAIYSPNVQTYSKPID